MLKSNLTRVFIFSLLSSLLIFFSVYEDWMEEAFLTLMLVVAGLGAFLLALIRQNFRRSKLLEFSIITLLVVFLLATFNAKVSFWSLLAFLRWVSVLSIFYLIIGLIETEKQAEKVVIAIIMAATLSALLGLYEFVLSGNPIEIRRLYGALHTHVWTAGYFLLVLPLALLKFLYEKNGKLKVIWGLLFALFLLVLVLTYARGAWVSLIPVVFGLGLILRKAVWKNKASLGFILGLVLLVVLSISSADLLLGRAQSLFFFYNPEKAASVQGNIPYDTAFSHRTSNYKNALRIVKDYPLLGVGLSNFGWIYHRYQDIPWVYSRYAHSSFLDILSETGILGFLAFLVFLGVCFLSIKKNILSMITKPNENVLALGLFGGVSASILHNFIESDWHVSVILMLFMIELALLVVLLRTKASVILLRQFRSLEKIILSTGILISLLMAFALRMSVYNFQAYLRASAEGDFDSARDYVRHSVTWSPIYPFAYEALGSLSLRQNELGAALGYFKKAEALNPIYPENSFNVGYVQAQLELNRESEESFKKVLKKGPYTTPRYYNALAQFYILNNQEEKAKQIYEEAVRHFPYTPVFTSYAYMYNLMKKHILESYLSLANIYLESDETSKAAELYTEALKFDPGNVQISEALEKID